MLVPRPPPPPPSADFWEKLKTFCAGSSDKKVHHCQPWSPRPVAAKAVNPPVSKKPTEKASKGTKGLQKQCVGPCWERIDKAWTYPSIEVQRCFSKNVWKITRAAAPYYERYYYEICMTNTIVPAEAVNPPRQRLHRQGCFANMDWDSL